MMFASLTLNSFTLGQSKYEDEGNNANKTKAVLSGMLKTERFILYLLNFYNILFKFSVAYKPRVMCKVSGLILYFVQVYRMYFNVNVVFKPAVISHLSN